MGLSNLEKLTDAAKRSLLGAVSTATQAFGPTPRTVESEILDGPSGSFLHITVALNQRLSPNDAASLRAAISRAAVSTLSPRYLAAMPVVTFTVTNDRPR